MHGVNSGHDEEKGPENSSAETAFHQLEMGLGNKQRQYDL